MTSNDIRSFLWCDVTFIIFYLLYCYLVQSCAVGNASNLPTFIQNDPNCNVQGDLKLQYTQHDFQQAPRQVVAQMVGLKMVLPEIGTNLTNPTGVLTGGPYRRSLQEVLTGGPYRSPNRIHVYKSSLPKGKWAEL